MPDFQPASEVIRLTLKSDIPSSNYDSDLISVALRTPYLPLWPGILPTMQ
jgi:hypothetical protein